MSLGVSFSNASLNRIFAHFKPKELTSSAIVNEELAKVITLLLRDNVSLWYQQISDDEDLFTEISDILGYVVSEIEHRLCKMDWVVLLCQDIPNVLIRHIQEHRQCSSKVGTAYSGGKTLDELFHGSQPHIALSSEETEREYLRRVADILMDTFLPSHEYQSEALKLLMREILANTVLYNLVDYISDPDYVNELILRAIDPDLLDYSPVEPKKEESTPLTSKPTNITIDPKAADKQKSKAPTSTLFEVNTKSSFFKRRKKTDSGQLKNFNFGKVYDGFEKIKNMRKARAMKRKETAEVNDLEFEGKNDHSDQNTEQEPKIDDQSEKDKLLLPDKIITDSENDRMVDIDQSNINTLETTSNENNFFKNITFFYSWIRKLYTETKVGPWKLGPIDTTKYDRYNLDEYFILLADEILDIQRQKKWIFTQLMFFIDPLLHGFGGPTINRAILRGIHFLISEEQIASYLQIYRLSWWPNNQLAPPLPLRSLSEKEEIKQELENTLINIFSPILSPVLGIQETNEKIKYSLDLLQNKSVNKHLLYIIMDLLLSHLIPEYAESRTNVS